MIRVRKLDVRGKSLLGLEVDIPNSPPAVMIIGEKGFAMCGFLNIEAADRVGVAAVMASGVRSVEDLLNSRVAGATSKALEMGVNIGERVEESLFKMETE
ncbi:MAG: DUF1805 domain-containing protein [Candidatus Korarchaeota archaeon]|nr:DUF1805 domain-containing protein [Candidatus Korarchaeota archaeon]